MSKVLGAGELPRTPGFTLRAKRDGRHRLANGLRVRKPIRIDPRNVARPGEW